LEGYLGGGIGFYHFTREVSGTVQDHLSSNVLGLHALAGIEAPLIKRFSVFLEARYAVAKVKSADPFDDSLDVGGMNYSLGIRWQFLPAHKPS
jgi:opacity protein-like surface antigen